MSTHDTNEMRICRECGEPFRLSVMLTATEVPYEEFIPGKTFPMSELDNNPNVTSLCPVDARLWALDHEAKHLLPGDTK